VASGGAKASICASVVPTQAQAYATARTPCTPSRRATLVRRTASRAAPSMTSTPSAAAASAVIDALISASDGRTP
jgi:hypothetical protein